MTRLAALALTLVACGGSPFTLAPTLSTGDDAAPVATSDAATFEGAVTIGKDGGGVQEEASEASEAPEASNPLRETATLDAGDAPEAAPTPPHVACHTPVGNVDCAGAGTWTIEFNFTADGFLTCDATHAPTVTCPTGARCVGTTSTNGAMYEGTCL